MTTCLEKLHEIGIEVISLTHDGSASNISMIKELGVSIETHDCNSVVIKPFFLHPVTKKNVFVFLDACHMLKLVRNTFAEKNPIGIDYELIK